MHLYVSASIRSQCTLFPGLSTLNLKETKVHEAIDFLNKNKQYPLKVLQIF